MVDKNLQNFANEYAEAASEIRDLEIIKEDKEWYYKEINRAKKGNVKCISMTFELEDTPNVYFCVKDNIKKELIELLLRNKEKVMQDLGDEIKEKENELKKIIKNFKDK